MGVLVQVEVVHYHHGMLHSLSMFSVVRSSRLQKECEVKKTKGRNKEGMSQVEKSVSVDGQKNADKNWSVQPNKRNYLCLGVHAVRKSTTAVDS